MRAFTVFVLCLMPFGILAQPTVSCTPSTATNVVAPVTSNSVFLQQPICCFDNIQTTGCTPQACQVWLVSALNTAMGTFDANKTTASLYQVCPCPIGTIQNTSGNYFLMQIGTWNNFLCNSTAPNYYQVGGTGTCPNMLPPGSTTSYKYVLFNPNNNAVLADTNWSNNITLNTVQSPSTIGDAYAGRSAAMIVITSILAAAAALLLLLLLIGLILACCCRNNKSQTYNTGNKTNVKQKRQTSILGSLRIPTYDVHHLKNPTPYDNLAFDRSVKMYAADTLPQATVTNTVQHTLPQATVTNTVQHSLPQATVTNTVQHNVVHHNVIHHTVFDPSVADTIKLQQL